MAVDSIIVDSYDNIFEKVILIFTNGCYFILTDRILTTLFEIKIACDFTLFIICANLKCYFETMNKGLLKLFEGKFICKIFVISGSISSAYSNFIA